MNKKTFILRSQSVLDYLIEYLRGIALSETHPMAVRIGDVNRTLEQNAAQWPLLEAIAKQLQWPVDGEMCWLTSDEFKDILTAGFKGEKLRLAKGVNGGVVMLGLRTSKMGKQEFSEWLEFLHWFCADRGVNIERERKAA